MLEEARRFAAERHVGQVYDKERRLPYTDHLDAVVLVLRRFGIAELALLVAGYLHDAVEDTPTTLEEVAARFGDRVAALVGAVTNEPGRNRAERNRATYPKIRAVPGAVLVKLADRIANVEYGGRLVKMYADEYPSFRQALFVTGECDGMWAHLDRLLGWVS